MGLSSLVSKITIGMNWTAENNLVGSDYQPIQQSGNIQISREGGTDQLNTSLNGANQWISYIVTVAGSSSTTVDCTSITNILQQTGVSLARVKSYVIRLLSVADDPLHGSNCESVKVGGAASVPLGFELDSPTMKFNVKNGDGHAHLSGDPLGICTIGAGAKNVLIMNSSTIAAAVQFTMQGSDT